MDQKIFIKGVFTKSDKQNGTFEVVASTDALDREGERIDQSGWQLDNYLKNPVILWGHDIFGLPIGKATDIRVEDGQLIIEGEFASKDANPMAEQVRLLLEEGILKTVSVGFIPLEREGDTITKAELLELSFVPVPANPEALALAIDKKLDLSLFSKSSSESPEGDRVVDDEKLKARLLYGKAKEVPYNKRSFYKLMSKIKARKEEHNEIEDVVADDLMDVATEIKSAVADVIEQAVPKLEEATEKQLEGSELMTELMKELDEIIDKTIDAEVAPLASDIEDVVEEVVTEDGTKQDEVEQEVESVVTLSFDGIAADIVDESVKAIEDVAAEMVSQMDDETRQEGEETVAEVVETIEKDLESVVEEVLNKNVEPIVQDATEAAEEVVAEKAGHTDEDEEEEEEKKKGKEKDICNPDDPDYDPEKCAERKKREEEEEDDEKKN